MDIFSFLRDKGSLQNPSDEMFYEFVSIELSNSILKQGLWTKALSDCEWDEQKAKALYVKMRVTQLRENFLIELEQQQSLLSDPVAIAMTQGLTDEDIEYLGIPIKASTYIKKYKTSESKLNNAINYRGFPAVNCNKVLWVKDCKLN